jgi:PEGA domain
MARWRDFKGGSRDSQINLPADPYRQMAGWLHGGTVLGKRYRVMEAIDSESFTAEDLALCQTVIVRQAVLTGRRDVKSWRQKVRRLASVRHPNFLNILDLILYGSRDLVVTERPLGHSIAEFLKERNFDLENVVRLMPLSALDLAATYASRPNPISARWLFVETPHPQDEQVDPNGRSVSDWPPFVMKLNMWEVVRPRKSLGWPFLNSGEQESGSRGSVVRQTALLTYELLGGEKEKNGEIKRGFKPVNGLGDAGNSILFDGLQRSPLFESSEGFFHALESAIRSNDGESRAISALPSHTQEHSAPSLGTNDVIRRFDRDTVQLATLVVSAVVCVALLFAVLVQERHPKTADLTDEARQAGGNLILDADRRDTPFEVVGLNKKRFTGVTPAKLHQSDPGPYTVHLQPEGSSDYEQTVQIRSGQSTSVDHALTVSARFSAHRQDSTRMIRLKKPNVRSRSSAWITSAEVKMRLIALWHQSLVRSKESRSWTAFSNLKREEKQKAAYTARTDP